MLLLTRAEAAKKLGRSKWTIRDWELKHNLLTPIVGDDRVIRYSADELLAAARTTRVRYRERSYKPGPGRGVKHPLRAEVAALLAAEKPPAEIADTLRVSAWLVASVRREASTSTNEKSTDTSPDGCEC